MFFKWEAMRIRDAHDDAKKVYRWYVTDVGELLSMMSDTIVMFEV
jgi:hypothetical protein